MFELIRIENARLNVPEPVSYETSEAKISIGQALVLANGKLAICETGKPQFIAMSAKKENGLVAVCRVESNQLYEVPVSAEPAALTDLEVGEKVALAEDGLQVTADTENGVAEIVNLNGAKASGDKIVVRF